MTELATQSRDLPHLLELLTNVVTTLDAVGADGYDDVFLYVAGSRDGTRMGELSLERDDIWISTAPRAIGAPDYRHGDADGGRRALLAAELCYLMWSWRWELEDVARSLGTAAVLLDRWIAGSEAGRGSDLPQCLVPRLRRLLVVEHLRLLAGVPDAGVAGWVRLRRAGLGGRSVLELLSDGGEPGFRRVLLMLMNGAAAASDTVH